MTPSNVKVIKILVAAGGLLVALGTAYLDGGLAGIVKALPSILGGGGAGAVLFKRLEDISPAMLRQAEDEAKASDVGPEA